MLMSLGQFVFALPDLAYSELQRSTAWRHAINSRVGARPALQYVGQGDDTLSITGELVPEIAGRLQSLVTLRAMADAGDAYAMVDGAGRILGAWVIESIEEAGRAFTRDGIARHTRFTLALRRSDDALVSSAPPGNGIATTDRNGASAANIA